MATLQGHVERILGVAFSPDGSRVVSSSTDETTRVWSVEDGVCLLTSTIARPYEGMDITGAKGLGSAQKEALKLLGAVERGKGVLE